MSSPEEAALFDQLLDLTGLPEDLLRDEVVRLLSKGGETDAYSKELTLDQLREALLHELERMHAEMSAGDISEK